MPTEWSGELIKKIHMNGLTIKAVAEKAGLNDKYVSQVLHSEHPSHRSMYKLSTAIAELSQDGSDDWIGNEKKR